MLSVFSISYNCHLGEEAGILTLRKGVEILKLVSLLSVRHNVIVTALMKSRDETR